jgi:hypothetical protein
MKLTENANALDLDHWTDLQDHQYLLLQEYSTDKLCSIVFKCPGCKQPLSVTNTVEVGRAHWEIDFETMTVSPSILHDRSKGGCGWHGYMKAGELTGQVE